MTITDLIPGLKGHGRRRAVDKVEELRQDLNKALTYLHQAGDEIALLRNDVTEAHRKQAEAEEIVVTQLANLDDLHAENDSLREELAALKTRFAVELAAEANANAITVPPMVRDTTAIEDQATMPIPVIPLHQSPMAHTGQPDEPVPAA